MTDIHSANVHQTVRRILVAAALGLPAASLVAATVAESDTLTEVLVTAQKREQNLQSVPISIQVLTDRKSTRLNSSHG